MSLVNIHYTIVYSNFNNLAITIVTVAHGDRVYYIC